ncbi:MAG TPA: NTP transferase domain-containing protein [Saprospiraceae bacterium]|nr:NTP transferase domain-containing protein [Saprospiraceae bacterium]
MLRTKSAYAALILAGGKSSRMGFPKAFLNHDGTSLCGHIVRSYREAGIGNIKIVLNSDFIIDSFMPEILRLQSMAEIIPNDFPERGRSYSIQSGVRALGVAGSCFVHNVDNPAISTDIIRQMLAALKPDGYVAPVFGDLPGHPVLLGKAIMEEIALHRHEDWILKDVLRRFERTCVAFPDRAVCFNINSEEEWNLYLQHLEIRKYVLPGHAALVGESQ